MMELPHGASLEAQLLQTCKTWSDALKGIGLPNGSPAVVIVCAAAMGVVTRIKELPTLNAVKTSCWLVAAWMLRSGTALAIAWTVTTFAWCRNAELRSCSPSM